MINIRPNGCVNGMALVEQANILIILKRSMKNAKTQTSLLNVSSYKIRYNAPDKQQMSNGKPQERQGNITRFRAD